eukprot:7781082-Lingulodinium_polyedra.AAC.1
MVGLRSSGATSATRDLPATGSSCSSHDQHGTLRFSTAHSLINTAALMSNSSPAVLVDILISAPR